MIEGEQQEEQQEQQENIPVPFFKTWKSIYVFVLGFLVFLIILFLIITYTYK